jgi:hypothetical protein
MEKSDPGKGTPNRNTMRRAAYLLEDFSSSDAYKLLTKLAKDAPQVTATAICEYWEENIERRK